MRALALVIVCCACGSRSGLPSFEFRDAADDAVRDAPNEDQPEAAPALPCFSLEETVLAAEEPSATALAVDATHLYWASPGSDCSTGRIRSVPKTGGSIVTLASDQPNPRNVAVDDARVYFRDGCGTGFLRSVAKTGGPFSDHPISTEFTDPRVLAVDAENIYFNAYGVHRIPKQGGVESVLDPNTFALALVADAGGVYWTGGDAGSYGVFGYHLGDAAPTELATPTGTGYGLALDASWIYFNSDPGIWRLPRTGGEPSFVVEADAWKIAVDDSNLYWSEGVLGSSCYIKKAPKTGGPVTEISVCDGAYVDIVVDDRCVYWADLYAGVVTRAAK